MHDGVGCEGRGGRAGTLDIMPELLVWYHPPWHEEVAQAQMTQLQDQSETGRKTTSRGRRKPRALRRVANAQPGCTEPAPDESESLGATEATGAPQAAAGQPTSAVHPSLPCLPGQSVEPVDVPGGNGGLVEGQNDGASDCTKLVQTALFDDNRHMKWDARQARRAALQDWRPDRAIVRAAVAKLSNAVIDGEMNGNPLSPTLVIKGIEVLHSFDRLIVANEHHEDRVACHEMSVKARVNAHVNVNTGGVPAAVEIILPATDADEEQPLEASDGLRGARNSTSSKSGVVVYLPDNGRSAPMDDPGARGRSAARLKAGANLRQSSSHRPG